MDLDIVVKRRFKNPGYKVPVSLMKEIGKVVIVGSIIDNVSIQRQAAGGELKANPPGYRAAKRAKGWGDRSLVAGERSFISKSNWLIKANTKEVSVKPRSGKFSEKVKHVQKRNYTGWFDVNVNGFKALKALIRKFALARLKKAQG